MHYLSYLLIFIGLFCIATQFYFFALIRVRKRNKVMDEFAIKYGLTNKSYRPTWREWVSTKDIDINNAQGEINGRQIRITDQIALCMFWAWSTGTVISIDGKIIKNSSFLPTAIIGEILHKETKI